MATSSPGRQAGALDREHQRLERLFVAVERRPPAALVGHTHKEAAFGHQASGGVVDLRRRLQGRGEGFGARRDDHEILYVGAPPGMGAAAEDLDFRQGNERRPVAGEMAPQREPAARRGGVQRRERNRGRGVAAEARKVVRAVQRDERRVERFLVERIGADERGRDLHADASERASDVEPAEARAAVALLDCLAAAARRAGRDDRAPDRPVAQGDFRFHRRTAARIPDAPPDERLDDGIAHGVRLQAAATSARVCGGAAISGVAQRRTASRSLSPVRYSTGDLPSTRARNRAGRRAAARASRPRGSSQSTPSR